MLLRIKNCGSGGIGSCLELDAGFRFQND